MNTVNNPRQCTPSASMPSPLIIFIVKHQCDRVLVHFGAVTTIVNFKEHEKYFGSVALTTARWQKLRWLFFRQPADKLFSRRQPVPCRIPGLPFTYHVDQLNYRQEALYRRNDLNPNSLCRQNDLSSSGEGPPVLGDNYFCRRVASSVDVTLVFQIKCYHQDQFSDDPGSPFL